MTAPRQVLPGTTHFVTRRCSERRLFLTPSKLTNEIFLYVLAVAAGRYRVRIHAFCVLSNHYHLLVTDDGAELPAFVQYLDSLVARATNASLGRWDGFWEATVSFSAVRPDAPSDAVRKTAYILANPVAAGLVRHAREWPGLWTAPEQLGTAKLTAQRPKVFFGEHGAMPASAVLELSAPPGFLSAQEYQDLVTVALRELEASHQRERRSKGRSFLGRARVLAQNPLAYPTSGEPRRGLSPRVAASDRWRKLEALSRLIEFLRAYYEARVARRAGARDVVFPAGTYQLRIEHGVPCAAPG